MAKKAVLIFSLLALFGLIFGLESVRWPAFGPAPETAGEVTGAKDKAGSGDLADASLIGAALAQGILPPVANAGFDQTFAVNDVVQLDGSGSVDPKGKVLNFSWSVVSVPVSSVAVLSDATAVKPSFTIDLAGDYVFALTVQR